MATERQEPFDEVHTEDVSNLASVLSTDYNSVERLPSVVAGAIDSNAEPAQTTDVAPSPSNYQEYDASRANNC